MAIILPYRKSRLRFLWWLLFLCFLNSGRPWTGVTDVVTATLAETFSCITSAALVLEAVLKITSKRKLLLMAKQTTKVGGESCDWTYRTPMSVVLLSNNWRSSRSSSEGQCRVYTTGNTSSDKRMISVILFLGGGRGFDVNGRKLATNRFKSFFFLFLCEKFQKCQVRRKRAFWDKTIS